MSEVVVKELERLKSEEETLHSNISSLKEKAQLLFEERELVLGELRRARSKASRISIQIEKLEGFLLYE